MSGDTGPQFVDTNILVYAHDASAGSKGDAARALLESLWDSGEGCLSVQVLQEFFAVTTRRTKRLLEPAAAAAIVADFARWRVHSPLASDVLAAIELHRKRQVSLWDAMILRSAAQVGSRLVWSEDLGPGQDYGGMTVRSPF
jgi:predicted nucleic acid-binding protein